jgi:hypothetical protein
MSSRDDHTSRRDFLTGVIALGPAMATLAAGAAVDSPAAGQSRDGAPRPTILP